MRTISVFLIFVMVSTFSFAPVAQAGSAAGIISAILPILSQVMGAIGPVTQAVSGLAGSGVFGSASSGIMSACNTVNQVASVGTSVIQPLSALVTTNTCSGNSSTTSSCPQSTSTPDSI